MSLSNISKTHLNEIRKWTFFLSILGFVLLGLMVLAGFFMGSFMSQVTGEDYPFPGFVLAIPYLFIGAVYFFPIYYLYKFSVNMKAALFENTESNIDIAFQNLKSHYKFMGILVIIMLFIYLLVGFGLLMMGSAFF